MKELVWILLFTLSRTLGKIETQAELDAKWGTDFGFSGIVTFAHLEHTRCLQNPDFAFDIGIIGVPFDTAVSYRTGARFGPRAIRQASSRQTPFRSFNPRAGLNPYQDWAKVVDCGDIPVTPFDNALAARQMVDAFSNLLSHSAPSVPVPRLLALGGDHSIALPMLRALHQIHGQIAVVHFDAHLDTWSPLKYPSSWLDPNNAQEQSYFTHGTMFWIAHNESLIRKGNSVHAGLRTLLTSPDDYDDDSSQGWLRIASDDIDDFGIAAIAQRILDHVGTKVPVYLSVDIDVLDPSTSPGTGTPEPAGWTSRELIRLLRAIESLNIVAADIVEVAPAYDSGEITALAAAGVGYEILTSMVKKESNNKAKNRNTLKEEL